MSTCLTERGSALADCLPCQLQAACCDIMRRMAGAVAVASNAHHRQLLLAMSTCCLLVMVGSGGCPTPGANSVGGPVSTWGLCACLRHPEDGNVGVKHWGHGLYCAETVRRVWGLSWGLQVLRPRGGSDHRSLSLERNSAARDRRGPPPRNGRQDSPRRSEGGPMHRESRGGDRWRDRGDQRGDWGDDRRMSPRQEVGDKCVSILRGLGGVADLPRLVERWSSLYPRYSVSRDGQVVPRPMLYFYSCQNIAILFRWNSSLNFECL
jgi:hypothetical protein